MNLFLIDPRDGLVLGKLLPFQREEALEDLVFRNPEVLGDVYPVWRQVRGGAKPGIPDIIGIDQEGAVCIVEIKNIEVDESILPQVLAYAIWAENNPDSIAKMWLEKEDRPEDLNPNFDSYSVRIVVVAPSIRPSTAHHMQKIAFQVDLTEVNQYSLGDKRLLSVNLVESPTAGRVRPITASGTYDREWYLKSGYIPKAVDQYFSIIGQIEQLGREHEWPIETRLNKEHTSFKIGSSIAFGLNWANTREFALFFKLSDQMCSDLAPANAGRYRYETGWKQGNFKLEQSSAALTDYVPLMQACVDRIVGPSS